MKTILIPLILLSLFIKPVFSCYRMSPTAGFGIDELLAYSKEVVLAKAETVDYGKVTFEINEVLGKYTPFSLPYIYMNNGSTDEYDSSDFSNHSESVFWNSDTGRASFPCCICEPIHTFSRGHTYLLFIDAFGAMKSAERIRSNDDRWLKFVRKNLKEKNSSTVFEVYSGFENPNVVTSSDSEYSGYVIKSSNESLEYRLKTAIGLKLPQKFYPLKADAAYTTGRRNEMLYTASVLPANQSFKKSLQPYKTLLKGTECRAITFVIDSRGGETGMYLFVITKNLDENWAGWIQVRKYRYLTNFELEKNEELE